MQGCRLHKILLCLERQRTDSEICSPVEQVSFACNAGVTHVAHKSCVGSGTIFVLRGPANLANFQGMDRTTGAP